MGRHGRQGAQITLHNLIVRDRCMLGMHSTYWCTALIAWRALQVQDLRAAALIAQLALLVMV